MRLLIALGLLSSCTSVKILSQNINAQDIKGTYKAEKGKGYAELIFTDSSFAFVDSHQYHMPTFSCCDTIAYGNWKLDSERGFISVSSPEELNTSTVSLEVQEKTIEEDVFIFKIGNPLERAYRKYNSNYSEAVRDILYDLYIYNNSGLVTDIETTEFNTDYIKIPRSSLGKIVKFEIVIKPNTQFLVVENVGTKMVITLDYEVKNPSSNFFEVNIPQLDYGYLTYLRLNNDYIKVVSKNKLEWDGKTYVK